MNHVLAFSLLGVLGVLAHTLSKLNSLYKKSQVANMPFDAYRDYIHPDRFSILLSFVSIAIWYFVYNEIEGVYSKISAWKGVSFVAVGFFGSYVVQKLGSRGEKKIDQVIDAKTNVADNVIGTGATSKAEVIEKAEEAGVSAEQPK